MYGKFFIQYPSNMVTKMEENVWLNVRNAEAKLPTQEKDGQWQVVQTKVARKSS